MKITEMFDDKIEHDTPGKASTAFMDYLNHINQWLPDRAGQQLKNLASALIKQGFKFETAERKDHGVFRRGQISINLPASNQTSSSMGKVNVYFGNSLKTYQVTIAKAARIDYSKVQKAYEALLDAELELRGLFS